MESHPLQLSFLCAVSRIWELSEGHLTRMSLFAFSTVNSVQRYVMFSVDFHACAWCLDMQTDPRSEIRGGIKQHGHAGTNRAGGRNE